MPAASSATSPDDGGLTETSLSDALGAQLSAALRRQLRYPEHARRLGLSGSVRLRFTLLPDGTLADITVLASSGSASLDEAAVAALRAIAPFEPARDLLSAPRTFEVPAGFRLEAAHAW